MLFPPRLISWLNVLFSLVFLSVGALGCSATPFDSTEIDSTAKDSVEGDSATSILREDGSTWVSSVPVGYRDCVPNYALVGQLPFDLPNDAWVCTPFALKPVTIGSYTLLEGEILPPPYDRVTVAEGHRFAAIAHEIDSLPFDLENSRDFLDKLFGWNNDSFPGVLKFGRPTPNVVRLMNRSDVDVLRAAGMKIPEPGHAGSLIMLTGELNPGSSKALIAANGQPDVLVEGTMWVSPDALRMGSLPKLKVYKGIAVDKGYFVEPDQVNAGAIVVGGVRYLGTAVLSQLVSFGDSVVAPGYVVGLNNAVSYNGRVATYVGTLDPLVLNVGAEADAEGIFIADRRYADVQSVHDDALLEAPHCVSGGKVMFESCRRMNDVQGTIVACAAGELAFLVGCLGAKIATQSSPYQEGIHCRAGESSCDLYFSSFSKAPEFIPSCVVGRQACFEAALRNIR